MVAFLAQHITMGYLIFLNKIVDLQSITSNRVEGSSEWCLIKLVGKAVTMYVEITFG